MTTLFIDYQGGNDNYAGSSFALLASGTAGRITSTTFSAAGASFPNDGSLINQYITVFNGTIYALYQITAWISGTSLTIAAISGGTPLANQAVDRQYYIGGRWKTIASGATAARIEPGDNLRLMASPEPTSLGSATWTGGVSSSSTFGVYKQIASSTNASPIVITCSTNHGFSTGETIAVVGHSTNTFANGLWQITKLSDTTFSLDGSTGNGVGGATGSLWPMDKSLVKLGSAVTQTIANCSLQEGAWTASANVTTSVDVTNIRGPKYGGANIAVAAGFTTGKAAYFATGTLDLSGYEQVTLLIKQSAGTVLAASGISIRLCSDTIGDVSVNTAAIPAFGALNQWYPVTVNLAAALGASIKSVALYVDTDAGAQTFQIAQILAAKAASSADSLTFNSLIGKNAAGEAWFMPTCIDGARVYIGQALVGLTYQDVYKAYAGTSETVTTYKRDTIPVSSGITLNESSLSPNARINLLGGWDRTNMSSQTGDTFYSATPSFSAGTMIIGTSGWHVDKLHTVDGTIGYNGGSWDANIGTMHIVASRSGSSAVSIGTGSAIDAMYVTGCQGPVVFTSGTGSKINTLEITNGNFGGITTNGEVSVNTLKVTNSKGIGGNATWLTLNIGGRVYANTAHVYGHAVSVGGYEAPSFYAKDLITNNSLETIQIFNGTQYFSKGYQAVSSTNDDGTHRIYGYGGSQIVSDAAQVHGAAVFSWKMSPTSSVITSKFPLYLPVAKLALEANVATAISVWMRRSNTGLTMRLFCKGGQLDGLSSDTYTDMTEVADTWEKVTISLTPTEEGVVELEAHAFGGSTYNGWVGEMEIA